MLRSFDAVFSEFLFPDVSNCFSFSLSLSGSKERVRGNFFLILTVRTALRCFALGSILVEPSRLRITVLSVLYRFANSTLFSKTAASTGGCIFLSFFLLLSYSSFHDCSELHNFLVYTDALPVNPINIRVDAGKQGSTESTSDWLIIIRQSRPCSSLDARTPHEILSFQIPNLRASIPVLRTEQNRAAIKSIGSGDSSDLAIRSVLFPTVYLGW